MKSPLHTGEEKYITEAVLKEIGSWPSVERVVPVVSTVVSVLRGGWNQYLELEGVVPGDPELRTEDTEGGLTDGAYNEVLLSQGHRALFGDVAIGDSVIISVERTTGGATHRFPIKCRVAGFSKRPGMEKIRAPLEFASALRLWSRGYGIARLGLPADPNHELLLGSPRYPRCRAHPFRGVVSGADSIVLSTRGLALLVMGGGERDTETPTYILRKRSGEFFVGSEWEQVSFPTEWVLVPEVDPVLCSLGGVEFRLSCSLPEDPLRGRVLTRGRWLGEGDSRFTVVVPSHCAKRERRVPWTAKLAVGNTLIGVQVVGISSTDLGYAHPELVYRLSQVARGEALFDSVNQSFCPLASPNLHPGYEIARVYVRELEQVIPSSRKVQELGFETEVREAQLLSLGRTRRMLNNLVLLIGFTTYFAILLSEGGVMFEAVLRKRRQIGVMRILGVPRHDVVNLFLLEALIVALVGWLCANVVFALFAPLADTTVVHAWLGLPQTGSLFSLRWSIRLAVGGVLCFLALFSGYLPAKYAGRIEPGIVLSEHEMQS